MVSWPLYLYLYTCDYWNSRLVFLTPDLYLGFLQFMHQRFCLYIHFSTIHLKSLLVSGFLNMHQILHTHTHTPYGGQQQETSTKKRKEFYVRNFVCTSHFLSVFYHCCYGYAPQLPQAFELTVLEICRPSVLELGLKSGKQNWKVTNVSNSYQTETFALALFKF